MATHDKLNRGPDVPLSAWQGNVPALDVRVGPSAGQPPNSVLLTTAARQLRVLGVTITDMPFDDAVKIVSSWLDEEPPVARSLYFVNAHTLNLAYEDEAYRGVLDRADCVFGDGTGVRWAARRQGLQLQANLNGTDLVPAVLERNAGRGFRYYLLGTTDEIIERAAEEARRMFPGWELAGCHHGFLDRVSEAEAIADINRVEPHLLLVALGNPLQEMWIDAHRAQLRARVCLGVGALADRWAGELIRAPLWVRRLGFEWLDILRRQPHKWRRYLLGNPKFLFRVCRQLVAAPGKKPASAAE